MTEKEATVFIVDVGRSMGEKCHGRQETDLDWSMRYVWDKITTAIATGRKTIFAGVIALHTDNTDNVLAQGDESYNNISVLQPLQQTLMPDVRRLAESITPSNTYDGDTISAIVLAMQMIENHCKRLKYKRQIVLVTNGVGVMEADDTLKQIAGKIKSDDIALTILGVDFDDADYGVKEEDKDPNKQLNEQILENLAEDCDGLFGTMAQAIEQLDIPRVKSTRSVATYKGLLTLGDTEHYDSAMGIDVERYTKVMIAKPQAASKFVVRDNLAPGEATQEPQSEAMDVDGDGLTAVRQARTYQVDDPKTPGGKIDVPQEELAKGYEYGRTAVPISESDMNVVNLETRTSMDIIGFVDAEAYQHYFNMSRSSVIIGSKVNDKAKMALSSLVHALHELNCFAVARFVAKDNKGPVVLLLAPNIEADYECLMDVELPFAEDVRQYTFPPLDQVVTVAGKKLYQHRNLPNNELTNAMGDFIEAMDLSNFDRDDDGKLTEYAKMEDTYSAILHRINQVIRWRAVHPEDGSLPPLPDILVKYAKPPEHLVGQTQSVIDKLVRAADVKKVPPRQKGRKRARETEKPLSGLDVDALLGGQKRTKISPDNAIPEFKQLLATTEDMGDIADAVKQLGVIIQNYIKDSVGDSGYGKAVEAIRVMKEEMNELEEPGLFNDFLRDLKPLILEGKLGGERKEMWFKVRANRLGLLDKRATGGVSKVTEEEAKAFLSAKL